MQKTQLKLEYQKVESRTKGISVIIVAAGSSTRMGVNKQFLNICGIPVIARTLMAFEMNKHIKNIILVVRKEDIIQMQGIAEKYMITKLSDIVCGGNTRQQSVLKGISMLNKQDKRVLIHDGARPLVSQEVIENVVSSLEKADGVVCGVTPKDTVKKLDSNGFIVNTLDRNSLFLVQTPQGVDIEKYTDAVNKAGNINNFTDDGAILENAGYKVLTVNGDYKNIKITTAEDIIIAESLLKEASECE